MRNCAIIHPLHVELETAWLLKRCSVFSDDGDDVDISINIDFIEELARIALAVMVFCDERLCLKCIGL